MKIILTLLLGLTASFAGSHFLQHGQKKYYDHKAKRLTEILENNTYYDVAYLGSSRVYTTVNPKIIDSVTGFKSYNIGVEGGNLYEFKITLDAFLVNHPPPKALYLAVDGRSFDIQRRLFFPPQYFRFINNPEIKKAFLNQKDYQTFLIEYFPLINVIYYDDYTRNKAIAGLTGKRQLKDLNAIEYNGFLSNGNDCVSSQQPRTSCTNLQFDHDALGYLQAIIDTCKSRGITLFLTYAPEYNFKLQAVMCNFNAFVDTMRRVANYNQLIFYRDDSLSMCAQPCLFANNGHVNSKGAEVYSFIVGDRIKKALELSNKLEK